MIHPSMLDGALLDLETSQKPVPVGSIAILTPTAAAPRRGIAA